LFFWNHHVGNERLKRPARTRTARCGDFTAFFCTANATTATIGAFLILLTTDVAIYETNEKKAFPGTQQLDLFLGVVGQDRTGSTIVRSSFIAQQGRSTREVEVDDHEEENGVHGLPTAKVSHAYAD
jgi:hypothetical protein